MKKYFLTAVLAGVFIVILSTQISLANNILEVPKTKVNVNGNAFKSDNVIVNMDGRLLLPFREIFNSLGITDENIFWDGRRREVKAIALDKEIRLTIDSNKVLLNSEEIEIDSKAVIYNDRTYVPLRFIAQSLGKIISWDDKTKTASIMEKEKFQEVKSVLREVVKNQKELYKNVLVNYKVSATSKLNGSNFVGVDYLGTSKIDLDNSKAHIKYDVVVAGMKNTVEYYVTESEKIKYNINNGNWDNAEISKDEISDIFSGVNVYAMYSLIIEDELVNALKISETEDEYILSGNTVIESITRLIDPNNTYKNLVYNAEKSEIRIDKDSMTIKSINMQVDQEIKEEAGTREIRINAEYYVEGLGNDFNIIVPKTN